MASTDRARPLVPFVSIDPGVDYLAAAWWDGGGVALTDRGLSLRSMQVRAAQLIKRHDWGKVHFGPGYDLVIIERPQIYRHGKAKTKDVEGLLIASGEIASHFKDVVWYRPAQWKGQQPKPAHQKKIKDALSEIELQVLQGFAKKELVHIWDAVGLGLYHLGRLT